MEAEAVAPLASAKAVAVLTNTAGAAWTEFAEIEATKTAAGTTTPRCVKNLRNFSTARSTRFLTAGSLAPKAAPTSLKLWPSK